MIQNILRGFFVFNIKTKTRPWRHIPRHRDPKTKKPRHRDSKTKKPRHRDSGTKKNDIEKQRQLSHDIVIPRHFFRGRKATTSRFQDQKVTTSSFCRILTLMPPDKSKTSGARILRYKHDGQTDGWTNERTDGRS